MFGVPLVYEGLSMSAFRIKPTFERWSISRIHETTQNIPKQSEDGSSHLLQYHTATSTTQARTHVYDYYKQVSRRRHQYGDPDAMSFIPLTPLDHMGTIPAYKAGVDAITSDSGASLDGLSQAFQAQPSNMNTPRQHQLPPLAAKAFKGPGRGKGKRGLGSRESSAGNGEPKGGDSPSNSPGRSDKHDVGNQCLSPQGCGLLLQRQRGRTLYWQRGCSTSCT